MACINGLKLFLIVYIKMICYKSNLILSFSEYLMIYISWEKPLVPVINKTKLAKGGPKWCQIINKLPVLKYKDLEIEKILMTIHEKMSWRMKYWGN